MKTQSPNAQPTIPLPARCASLPHAVRIFGPALTFVLLALIAVLVAPTSASAQVSTVRGGDRLDIRISGVPMEESMQFSKIYAVDETGQINLPYIGEVRAAGMSTSQLQSAIEGRYKSEGIYTNPTITIVMDARFVNVGGYVRSPTRIVYTEDLTLLSAITAAGGFNPFADQKKVRLIRNGQVSEHNAAKARGDANQDIRLLPGDTIEVPKSRF